MRPTTFVGPLSSLTQARYESVEGRPLPLALIAAEVAGPSSLSEPEPFQAGEAL